MTAPTVAEIAGKLTKAQREALLALPTLRDADPVRWLAAVTHGNSWRKLTKHRPAFRELAKAGLVESKEARNETLWRATKPFGLAVRAAILKEQGE
jgi:hypothetical protein